MGGGGRGGVGYSQRLLCLNPTTVVVVLLLGCGCCWAVTKNLEIWGKKLEIWKKFGNLETIWKFEKKNWKSRKIIES